MKIAIDVNRLYTAQTGVSVYVRQLSEHLLQQPEHEIVRLHQSRPKANAKNRTGSLNKILKHARHLAWTQAQLPLIARSKNCRVLLCPEVASPIIPVPGLRTVATVHDMVVRLYPEGFDHRWRSLYHLFDENSLRFAHRIICDSASTRQDLLRLLPHLSPEKVRVVHLAAGSHFRPLAPDVAFREGLQQQFGLEYQQYLLFVGARNVRKNLPNLIKAFARIAQSYPALRLVLAGPSGGAKAADATPAIEAAIREQHLTNRVLIAENLSDEDLVRLYNGAAAFGFVSRYEGFGMPPLEAMACGTPVICTCNSSLPEVVGEAALYVEDPDNLAEIASRLETLLENPALAAELRQKGFAQAAKFPWQKTARETLAILLE